MGKAHFFFGTSVGAGTSMKLVVNKIMAEMMASLAEGMVLTEAVGLDGNKLVEVLSLGAMANPMFALKGPKMSSDDHAPHFPLKHATKDLRFALNLAKAAGVPRTTMGQA